LNRCNPEIGSCSRIHDVGVVVLYQNHRPKSLVDRIRIGNGDCVRFLCVDHINRGQLGNCHIWTNKLIYCHGKTSESIIGIYHIGKESF
jgi:hypothetical protein